jgi:asparagine synthase (glutamine-hydrolysing)
MINRIAGVLGTNGRERFAAVRPSSDLQVIDLGRGARDGLALVIESSGSVPHPDAPILLWIDGEEQHPADAGPEAPGDTSERWIGFLSERKKPFALAAWHRDRSELLLARDLLGACPLYYAPLNNGKAGLAFGSELSTVARLAGASREPDPTALSDYLTYLYIPFPRTIFSGVYKVPPGHCVLWRGGGLSTERFADFDMSVRPTDEASAVSKLREALDATLSEMCGSGELGVFLSGGLDSSTSLGFARRHRKGRIPTFSLGFRDAKLYDEADRVSFLVDHFKTDHHQLEVGAEAVSRLDEIARHYDEPFGNSTSLLIYELAREASGHVPAVLTGDGGDEFFAGYLRLAGISVARTYRRIPRFVRAGLIDPLVLALPESLEGRHQLRRAREFVRGSRLPLVEMYVSWITYFDEEAKKEMLHPDVIAAAGSYDARDAIRNVIRKYPDDVELGAHYADLAFFLPLNGIEYVSKSTRPHGLAVRSPLLDGRTTSLATSLPMSLKLSRREPKYLLRRVAREVLPREALEWPKIGFNSPVGVWLKREPGRGMVQDLLGPESVRRRGLLRPEAVEALLEELELGRRDFSLEVWALMFLEAWCRHHVDYDQSR